MPTFALYEVNDLFIHFANLKHCYWAQGLRGPIRTFKPTFSPQRGLQGALLYEGLVVHAVYVPYDSISLRPLKVPLKPSTRNCHPFGTAFHSDWLRNNPKGPHAPFGPLGPLTPLGVGGGGGVGCPDEGVTESMASREFGGGTDILGET